MEKRIVNKVQHFNNEFKNCINEWLHVKNSNIINSEGNNITEDFRVYISNYSNITFEKEDFLKRKRIKNMAPQHERCCSKRANGTQCTRRKREDSKFCGTHIKGTPHGLMNSAVIYPETNSIDVHTQEIVGIQYWIDSKNNVYNTEDIMSNSVNPRVIAKWDMNEQGEYTIPSLDI